NPPFSCHSENDTLTVFETQVSGGLVAQLQGDSLAFVDTSEDPALRVVATTTHNSVASDPNPNIAINSGEFGWIDFWMSSYDIWNYTLAVENENITVLTDTDGWRYAARTAADYCPEYCTIVSDVLVNASLAGLALISDGAIVALGGGLFERAISAGLFTGLAQLYNHSHP